MVFLTRALFPVCRTMVLGSRVGRGQGELFFCFNPKEGGEEELKNWAQHLCLFYLTQNSLGWKSCKDYQKKKKNNLIMPLSNTGPPGAKEHNESSRQNTETVGRGLEREYLWEIRSLESIHIYWCFQNARARPQQGQARKSPGKEPQAFPSASSWALSGGISPPYLFYSSFLLLIFGFLPYFILYLYPIAFSLPSLIHLILTFFFI